MNILDRLFRLVAYRERDLVSFRTSNSLNDIVDELLSALRKVLADTPIKLFSLLRRPERGAKTESDILHTRHPWPRRWWWALSPLFYGANKLFATR